MSGNILLLPILLQRNSSEDSPSLAISLGPLRVTSVLVKKSLMVRPRRSGAVWVLGMQVCNKEHNIILSNQ